MNLPNNPKVLAATYNPVSKTKMISFLVDFPTVLLAELRTHRILTQGSLYEHMGLDDFNMSANSARAIPANKYLDKVLDNPFIPIWTGKQSGMSGSVVTKEIRDAANTKWIDNLRNKRHQVSRVWLDESNSFRIYKKSKPEKEDYDDLEEYQYDLEEHNDVITCFNESSDNFINVVNEKTLKSNYEDLLSLGIHKQNANRLLAPFAYTTCIISGTEWENFFELRCPKYTFQTSWAPHVYRSRKEAMKNHPPMKPGDYCSDHTYECHNYTEKDWQKCNKSGAQPEFQIIAEMLYDLYQEAEWQESKYHIPFYQDIKDNYYDEIRSKIRQNIEHFKSDEVEAYMKVSASMCAKLSYNTQENDDTLEKHLERANMLMTHKHWEPFSHQAIAMDETDYNYSFYKSMVKFIDNGFGKERTIVKELGWCYNLRGFISQRYMLENY